MTNEQLYEVLGNINETYLTEARQNHNFKKNTIRKWGAAAACFAVILGTVFAVFPNFFNHKGVTLEDKSNLIIDNTNQQDPPTVRMNQIHLNQISEIGNTRCEWYDPESYTKVEWDKKAIIDYYGEDLTPVYIPDGLTASFRNNHAAAFKDKDGTIVEDLVYLGFYHDYYEDGSPKLTENIAAVKGVSVKASKLGLQNNCCYILPENEVKTSDINGTAVTFGYYSAPYGPHDPNTHEPSGYYDMYVAEFEYHGIMYQIVTKQLEETEIIKVVSSIIYGKKVTVTE